MSLQVWLPLTRDKRNQGLMTLPSPWEAWTRYDSGKLGQYCYSDCAIYHMTEEWLDNEWSLACWVKSSGWSQYNDILLCKNISESTSSQFYFSIIGGTQLNLGANGGSGVTSYSYTFSTNTWYHVAATYDGTTICLYINGDQVKKVSYSSTKLNNMNNFCVGCRSTNSAGTSGTGNTGAKRLNDVRVYDNCLSAEEVRKLARGLVLHYPLNKSSLGPDNLIKNGFGELGTVNWTNSANISTTEIPSGQSDIKASFTNNYTVERIRIYPNHTYKFSTWIKATTTSGNTYPSLFPYDVDGKFINYYNCSDAYNLNTMTTLKQELKTGDTKIYVNDLSKWNADSGHYYNWAAIFSYTDGTGYTYPDGTYTQNLGRFGSSTTAKTNLDKTNNIITLTTAYTGPNMPMGTKLCATTEGATYFYPIGGLNLANIQDWTYKEGTFFSNTARLKYAKEVMVWTYYYTWMAGIKLQDITNDSMNGTVEYDCSGLCNNGTRTGTFSWNSDTPKYNVSQVFASGNNYIDCGASQTILPTDGLTVSLWCKYSTWGNPISCTEGGGWNFENGTNSIRFPVYVSGVGYILAESNIAPSTLVNNWHMITGTFDKTNVKIYIDGELKGTTATGSTNGIGYAANHCYVGAEASGGTSIASASFIGNISDVRIYATALSAEDVLALYENKL